MLEKINNEKIEIGIPSIGIPGEAFFNYNLTDNEQKLFGLIRNLSQSKRGCWASNRYLGGFLNKNPQTISNAIQNLKKYKYILIKNVKIVGPLSEHIERQIFVNTKYIEIYRPLMEKVHELLFTNNTKTYEVNSEDQEIIGPYKLNYMDVLKKLKDLAKEIITEEVSYDVKKDVRKKLLSNDNKVEKNNLVDNFSISNFNKDSLTRKIKKSLSDPEDYSEEVQSLFKFWQSLKIVNHKKSKSRNKALQDLDKALQKYSKEEIKKSMQAYKNLLDKCHNPIKSKSPYKIGLNEFFKFTKHTKDRIKKFHKDLQEMKSWFDLCLQDKDIYKEKFNGKIKDNYPLLTKKLIETIEGLSRKRKLDFDQENLCRKVSNVIYDLWSREYKNRKHFNLSARKYVMQFFSGYILPWIKKKANENEDFDIPWMLTTFFIDDINNICRKEIKRIKEEERAISFL